MPAHESSPSPAPPPAAGAAKTDAGAAAPPAADRASGRPRELGGRAGPEPTRFGDWEKHGRCIDF
ncbi:MAG: DUF1674 domain-containing protein [Gammaproteobacteria bacterium]|nr:DUF1674 domain-containing protein [Gammaproteobacteria bacterium]MBV8405196.1 DUF1674 domain-containing protein [Gammaproteobacteria bacterium]